jgi:hypothetical protein
MKVKPHVDPFVIDFINIIRNLLSDGGVTLETG